MSSSEEELRHRVEAYETVLVDLEGALYRDDPLEDIKVLAHRAHNVLCHLEDGCGH